MKHKLSAALLICILPIVFGSCTLEASQKEADIGQTDSVDPGEKHSDETAEMTSESELFRTQISSYYMFGKGRCSREEEPKLYENAEELMGERFDFWAELDSAGNSYMDLNCFIIIPNADGSDLQYHPLEGITSWDYFRDKANAIYAETYVENVITPEYTEGNGALFREQDNQLYRLNADGWPMRVDAIQVWRDNEYRSRFFYITGLIHYEMDDNFYIGYVQVNEDKPCGLEIIGECEVTLKQELQSVKEVEP